MNWLFDLQKTQRIAHFVCVLAFVCVGGDGARGESEGHRLQHGGRALRRHPFASNIATCDTPTVAYATVYRPTTLLRILSAQVLAITPSR